MCQVAQRINIYMCVVWIVGVILCNADMTASGGVCRICHGARRPCVAYTPHHTHASIHGARLVSATHAAHAYIDASPAGLHASPATHAARDCVRSGHAYTGHGVDATATQSPAFIHAIECAAHRATHRRACALDENAGVAKTKGAGRCRRPLTRKFTFHAKKKTLIASHGHSASLSTCMANKKHTSHQVRGT
jgi:hypothetical protein